MPIDKAVFVPYNQVKKGQKSDKGECKNANIAF